MPKKKANEVKTRAPLPDTGVTPVPSILKKGGPTRPPLKVEVEVVPSILKKGGPTRKPLPPLPGEIAPEPPTGPET